MRTSPRQVECCAVLGPKPQGETAFSPLNLLIGANLKGKRVWLQNFRGGSRLAISPACRHAAAATTRRANQRHARRSACRVLFSDFPKIFFFTFIPNHNY